jgi:hypothetical protein
MRRILGTVLSVLVVLSCSKELSEENVGSNTNPPLGDDCRVNQLAEIDSAFGFGTFSRFVQFNPDGQAIGARFFDSINNAVFYETAISYRGDTMRISPYEYFLLDASKRVKSFVSLDSNVSVPVTITIRYSYDGAGYLAKRELFLGNASQPEYWYTYKWQNGDLTEVEGLIRVPSGVERLLYSVMQYDQSVNIKGNLLPIPDGFEVYRFLSALNLGRLPQHLLTKTVVTLYDPNAKTSETFTNRNRSHKISSDGYIQEYTSYTEATPVDPADSSRVRLGYFCR